VSVGVSNQLAGSGEAAAIAVGLKTEAALEILGYRHNRAAMLTVATKYPLEAWTGRLRD